MGFKLIGTQSEKDGKDYIRASIGEDAGKYRTLDILQQQSILDEEVVKAM